MKKTISLLLVLGLFLAAKIGQADAISGGNTNSSGITAAGPRLGTIVVVEVTIPKRDALDELARAGYDISNVQGNVVTIYASLEELERLKETGYPLREIERQPWPAEASVMALGGYHNYASLGRTEHLCGGIP